SPAWACGCAPKHPGTRRPPASRRPPGPTSRTTRPLAAHATEMGLLLGHCPSRAYFPPRRRACTATHGSRPWIDQLEARETDQIPSDNGLLATASLRGTGGLGKAEWGCPSLHILAVERGLVASTHLREKLRGWLR